MSAIGQERHPSAHEAHKLLASSREVNSSNLATTSAANVQNSANFRRSTFRNEDGAFSKLNSTPDSGRSCSGIRTTARPRSRCHPLHGCGELQKFPLWSEPDVSTRLTVRPAGMAALGQKGTFPSAFRLSRGCSRFPPHYQDQRRLDCGPVVELIGNPIDHKPIDGVDLHHAVCNRVSEQRQVRRTQ